MFDDLFHLQRFFVAQEAATFVESGRLPNEVWELLPSFDKRIPLRWIMDSISAAHA
jgi:hypothetical protein